MPIQTATDYPMDGKFLMASTPPTVATAMQTLMATDLPMPKSMPREQIPIIPTPMVTARPTM